MRVEIRLCAMNWFEQGQRRSEARPLTEIGDSRAPFAKITWYRGQHDAGDNRRSKKPEYRQSEESVQHAGLRIPVQKLEGDDGAVISIELRTSGTNERFAMNPASANSWLARR